MHQDSTSALSPFAALSYQEQQDRWLEWRSRQLDYRDPGAPIPQETAPEKRPENELPPVPLPRLPAAAPTRHRELDQVWAKHRQALKQAGAFRSVSPGDR